MSQNRIGFLSAVAFFAALAFTAIPLTAGIPNGLAPLTNAEACHVTGGQDTTCPGFSYDLQKFPSGCSQLNCVVVANVVANGNSGSLKSVTSNCQWNNNGQMTNCGSFNFATNTCGGGGHIYNE
jgi:hypothetical protein